MNLCAKKLLGYNITTLKFNEIVNWTLEKIKNRQNAHIVTINPEIIELANNNENFKKAIQEADILIPDGIGIVLGFKIKGLNIQRTPGIEIAEALIQKAQKEGFEIGLLGANQEVLEKTKNNIEKKYPSVKISFLHNGFFDETKEKEIVEKIKNSNVKMLFVAMGIPKQEIFINNYKNELNRTIMIGVGGSFDVWAKKVQRAPEIYQKLGLEWFYRLITQPSRFSRMFPALPLFLFKVILSKLKGDNS